MSFFWGMVEHHMPGIAWICNCTSGLGWREMCERFGSGTSPEVVRWGKDRRWTQYEGPRNPEAVLEVVREAYELQGAQQDEKPTAQEAAGIATLEAQVKQTDLTKAKAIVAIAIPAMSNSNSAVKERAFELLERAFGSEVDEPLSGATPEGRALAYQIFVHRWSLHDYRRARAALTQALSEGGADCWRMQLATMIDKYPESEADADLVMARYVSLMRELLEKPALALEPTETYNFCLFSLFDHSFYYNADLALNTHLFTAVAAKAFPALLRPPPPVADGAAPARPRPCGGRLRLGIASGCFSSSSHPVPSDFGGVIRRLSPLDFDVVYIHFDDLDAGSSFLKEMGVDDFVHLSKRDDNWLEHARQRIAALRLDLLLYLDLTMSEMAHQTAMVRLAPLTAVSHGHPVSSGIPRDAMDYYISWAAAELPTAQEHYTEELALLPARTMHQYYESRIGPGGTSVADGGAFRSLRRADFELPARGHWYLCMQKPFKLSPAFDKMLAGIHAADPDGLIILHDVQFKGMGPTSQQNKRIYKERLRRAGVDLSRLHFVRQQPHHRLMALYSLADVVLDSYYAGGCTTTREALEVGARVVTLPAKYLGSRWSLAYYSIMGETELVAKDERHYVELAVRMATDADAAAAARQRILDNVHKLFHRDEAVEAWSTLLRRLAHPVTSNCTRDGQEKSEL